MEDYNRTGGSKMSRRTEYTTVVITLSLDVELDITDDPGNYMMPPDYNLEWKLMMNNSELNDLINEKIDKQLEDYDQ